MFTMSPLPKNGLQYNSLHGVLLQFLSLLWSQVKRDLLFLFLSDLESFRSTMSPDELHLKHLDVLIKFVKISYESIMTRLSALLSIIEITFNLL